RRVCEAYGANYQRLITPNLNFSPIEKIKAALRGIKVVSSISYAKGEERPYGNRVYNRTNGISATGEAPSDREIRRGQDQLGRRRFVTAGGGEAVSNTEAASERVFSRLSGQGSDRAHGGVSDSSASLRDCAGLRRSQRP